MRAASINDTHTLSYLSMCKVTKNFLQHQIICQVFDSRKKGLCVLGQLFGFFPRFVHKWGICPSAQRSPLCVRTDPMILK
jgi:hypothetical protein